VVTNAAGVCAQNRCNLIVGTNRITATVTAQDGTTRKAYVVVVTRAAGVKGSGKNLDVSRRDEPFAVGNYMGAIPAETRRKAGMRGSRM